MVRGTKTSGRLIQRHRHQPSLLQLPLEQSSPFAFGVGVGGVVIPNASLLELLPEVMVSSSVGGEDHWLANQEPTVFSAETRVSQISLQ